MLLHKQIWRYVASRINNFSPVPSRLSASPFPCFQFVILRTEAYDSPRANIRRSCAQTACKLNRILPRRGGFLHGAHGFSKPFRAPGSSLHARLQKRAICGRRNARDKEKRRGARTCGAPVTLLLMRTVSFAIQRVRTPILKIAVSIGVSHCCSSA